MVLVPVSAAPCFSKLLQIEIDALGKGIGVVLMQEGHPIAYMSQKISETTQRKSVYEQELMAIVLEVQRWQQYLLG